MMRYTCSRTLFSLESVSVGSVHGRGCDLADFRRHRFSILEPALSCSHCNRSSTFQWNGCQGIDKHVHFDSELEQTLSFISIKAVAHFSEARRFEEKSFINN